MNIQKNAFYAILMALIFSCKADFPGDRTAFPTYTRVLRDPRPRLVIIQPSVPPATVTQEQQARERLAERQLLEQRIKTLEQEEKGLIPGGQSAAQYLPHLTDEQIKTLYDRALQKRREAEIAGYTHMYGASEYGYSDQYPR